MILTDKKYKRILLLCLSGLFTGLCVAFPNIGIIEWLTLVPMAVFLLDVAADRGVKLRAMYGYGFLFFMSFYLVVFHWFVNLYPLEFIDGMTKGGAICVVLFASVGLSFFQAVQGALVFVLATLLFRSRVGETCKLLRPVILAALWAVYEWTQTVGWWGVPWGRLAIGQSEMIIGLQTASLFGSYFISFAIVLVNAYIAYGILCAITDRGASGVKAIRLSAVVCASVLAFQYVGGLIIWHVNAPKENAETVTVAAVQGNIPSGEKWEESTTEKTLSVYRKYTLLAAKQGADVVVWPETALPWTVKEGNSKYKYLSELAKEADVTILAGAFTYDGEGNEYNSIVCFTPDGEMSDTVYNKRHLVPFGEFVPFRGLIETLVPPLAELIMSGGDVAEGEGANIFELEEGNIGSIICFDSIYEELTLESVREGAELICLSTNDSWFTDSAALYMHNAQAQLRAIECGRYVVRSANTGISTVITDRGEVIAELEPLIEGMIVREVRLNSSRTLYSYIGNLFVWNALLFLIIITGVSVYISTAKRKKLKKT
ncbi:MAG: apolipoprotein N-acyltransferase [Clostridia bacterium]|nr:apolipoprotein N-acyltransferase [Clostridia bacterium]